MLRNTLSRCVAAIAVVLPAATAPVRPEQLQPFAGRWLQLTPTGKSYVIERQCDAETPSITVHADKLTVDFAFGQEDASYPVSSVRADSDRRRWKIVVETGKERHEPLEWTFVDAKRSIVRIKSERLFEGERFYVAEAKASAIPLRSSTRCDEFEK
jgi:hypothetical protein